MFGKAYIPRLCIKWCLMNKLSFAQSPVFYQGNEVFHGDNCEPLSAAANANQIIMRGIGQAHYPGQNLLEEDLPGLCSVGFWDARKKQRWGLGWHRNEGIEITYLARGKLQYSIDNQVFELKKGNVTIARPWQRHRVGNPQVTPSKLFWCIIDVGVRRPHDQWQWPDWVLLGDNEKSSLTRLLSQKEKAAYSPNIGIEAPFNKLETLLEETNCLQFTTHLKLAINEILLMLISGSDTDTEVGFSGALTSSEHTVQVFIEHLPKVCEQLWTIDGMAEQCGLGRTQFIKYFEQITNLSPIEFLTECRIKRAQQLLHAELEQTITEIAFECGFQSSGYFSSVFKKHTGYSPRDYKSRPINVY